MNMFKAEDGQILPLSKEEEGQRLSDENAAREKSELSKKFNYREKRAKAYLKALGRHNPETDILEAKVETLGDILDAVIKYVQGDKAELDEMITKIQKVKRDNPKPGV